MGASSSLSSASIETTSAMNSSMNTSTSTINTNSNIIVNTSKGNDNNYKNDLTTITSSPSGCPVQHKNIMTTTVGSSTLNSSSNSTTEKSSECPVKYKNPSVYNVYNTKINPDNQMPLTPNQSPSSTQSMDLSIDRVKSSIPKGGTDTETWTYPSPQMFWNSLARKNKLEGVSEQDMNTVIAIHNNMNENTWSQVLEWEKLRNPYVASYTSSSTATTTTPSSLVDTGRESKLLRFMGKPDDYSPKARIKMLFGHPPPFDRHDWIVDRGGIEVRYVIDYYHDESSIQIDKIPSKLTDTSSIQSIKVDVRPALDSISAFIDRLLIMPWKQLKRETNYYPPPFFPPSKMIIAEQQKYSRIQENWSEIATKCVEKKEKLALCSTEEECRVASVALQICTASIICPSIAQAFIQCTSTDTASSTTTANSIYNGASNDVNNNNNIMNLDYEKFQKAGAAYSSLVQCLELFEADSLKVLNAKKK